MAANTASNIFQIRDGDFETLQERPMRQGFYGETLESALQRLLCEHPEVMPGNQLVSEGEEAPRFLLLKREAPVGSWSLDHLFIDQFGVPTLVECKLIENRESRREVVGQIIEYAANARAEWSDGYLRTLANTAWSGESNEVDHLIGSELGVEDLDAFWQQVDTNLELGRIRLIIAGDHINTSVQRMIEYLNAEMRNTEVYGLEVNCYGPDSDNVVMMTRVIGRVQAVADKRAARSNNKSAKVRSVDELRDYFDSLDDHDYATVAISLLDWACSATRYCSSKTIRPAFRVLSSSGKVRIGVYCDGFWIIVSDLNDQDRQSTQQTMIDLELTSKPYDGKSWITLEKLTPDNVQRVIDYLK